MIRHAVALVAAGLLAATPLQAQKPGASASHREGFWWTVGLGAGSTGADCTGCSTDRSTGFSGQLALGGTISPSFLLGGGTNGWVKSESGTTESMGFASIVATFYPMAEGDFFFRLGLGGMTYKASNGGNDLTATAPSGLLGLGYDFRVNEGMSISPFVNVMGTSAVSFKLNGVTQPAGQDIKFNLVQFGVGVTWH